MESLAPGSDMDKLLSCPRAALTKGIGFNFVYNIVLACLLNSVFGDSGVPVTM